MRVTCRGGVSGYIEDDGPVTSSLRSKRSADDMDIDVPGPSKLAKATRSATAGALRVASPAGSLSPISLPLPSVDLTTVVPRPRLVTTSTPTLPPITPLTSSSSFTLPNTSVSVEQSEALLLSIRRVRARVNAFAAEIYRDLDDLEDKVREARSRS